MCFRGLSEITPTNFPVTERLFKRLFIPSIHKMPCLPWAKTKKIVKKLDENIKEKGADYAVKMKSDIAWLQNEILEMKFPQTKLSQQKNLIAKLGIILDYIKDQETIVITPQKTAKPSKESFAGQTGF